MPAFRACRSTRIACAVLLALVSTSCSGDGGQRGSAATGASTRATTGAAADVSPSTSPPEASATALDDVLAHLADTERQRVNDAVGGVVLVASGGRTRSLPFGDARLRPRRPMTAGARFPIASVTKMMTAVVVLQLVDEGRLHLEDTVEDLLPGMLDFGTEVTVEDLLDHRSGIVDAVNEPTPIPISTDLTDRRMRQLLAHPPTAPPGTVTRYTNAGFWVLGRIIERVTGHSYATALRQRILRPAGMHDTTVPNDLSRERRLAHGYDERNRDITPADFSAPWAAGGVVSSVTDLATFFDQLYAGRFLPQRVVEDMARPRGRFDGSPDTSYGLGTFIVDSKCGPVIGHFGDIDGFVIRAFRNPALDRVAIEFVNTQSEQATIDAWILESEALCYT